MPYACALAVCATFCHHIAPALIPIFGPSFPSRCVVPEAPEHGRFSIDPAIVIECTKEAERYRSLYSSSSSHAHSLRGDSRRSETRMLSPRSTPSEMRLTDPRDREMMDRGREREREDTQGREREKERHREYEHDRKIRTPLPSSYLEKRMRLQKNFGGADSPYGSGSTDTDIEYNSENSNDGYLCSPFTPSSDKSVIGSVSGSGFDRPYNQPVTPPRLIPQLPSPYLTALPSGSSHSPHFPSTNTNSTQSHFHHSSHPINVINHAHTYPPPPLLPAHSSSTASSPELAREHLHLHSINDHGMDRDRSQWRPKRRISEVEADGNDDGYDGEHEGSASSGSRNSDRGIHSNTNTMTNMLAPSGSIHGSRVVEDGPEKRAAWLLMNLSVRDAGVGAASAGTSTGSDGAGSSRVAGNGGAGVGLGLRLPGLMTVGGGDGASDFDAPRVKRRRRALSM